MLLAACEGKISGAARALPSSEPTPAEVKVPVQAMQRLTPRELDRTLRLLTADPHGHASELLPSATSTPFDNAVASQLASATWVEGVERLAEVVATETLADPARRALVLPCTPSGDQDLACLTSFTQTFGRRVLRRPLTADEVTTFTSLHTQALERGDFLTSVALIMRRLLADPEFHFRAEVGVEAGDLITLGPWERATRLAFFLQGHAPSDWLLDAAASGHLATPDDLRAAATRLVSEPDGRAHLETFHAMWLGFSALPHDAALNQRLVTETTALLRRVIFEQPGDYRRLFTSTETYVDATLAAHYGLVPPTGADFAWTTYGASGRKGILSHGSLLSNGVKQADTSPTLRGKWIRNRLFCQEIPPPPPNVKMDLPPPATGSAVCKQDRLAVHTSVGSCAGCHSQMDPIGFGLERYDRTGKFRTVEADHPECAISGDGALDGVGTFNGPAGLADLMVSSGALEQCAVTQLFRFQTGRAETADDRGLLAALTKRFEASGRRFDQLLVDLVADETFGQRRLETP